MAEPLPDQGGMEWRVLWHTGQATVGCVTREEAERVLDHAARGRDGFGEVQSRHVSPWSPLEIDDGREGAPVPAGGKGTGASASVTELSADAGARRAGPTR